MMTWAAREQAKELAEAKSFIERLKAQLRVSGKEAFKAGYRESGYKMRRKPDEDEIQQAWQRYSDQIA